MHSSVTWAAITYRECFARLERLGTLPARNFKS